MSVDPDQLLAAIHRAIDEYRYDPPPGLIGNPISPREVQRLLGEMRQALVRPYLQRFRLGETYEQVEKANLGQFEYGEFWVVAKGRGGGSYVEVYDDSTGEFALGIDDGDGPPYFIGVRGDPVFVFMAM